MSFGIGFGLVDCIPPGVVCFDGGDAESPPVTAVVSGDTFDVPTSVDESIIVLGGGGILLRIDYRHLLRRVATLHIDESTRPHRLRHRRRWAPQ